jgi:hypothetical protein
LAARKTVEVTALVAMRTGRSKQFSYEPFAFHMRAGSCATAAIIFS